MRTLVSPLRTTPVLDDAPARRALRTQIARLEAELAGLEASAWPRGLGQAPLGGGAGARLLGLGELEALRDALAARAADARHELAVRAEAEEAARLHLEQMLLDPAAHRFAIVRHADLGQPGCRQWHCRPRMGLLGMLMGWWRVVVSSGCPLAWAAYDRSSAPPPSSGASGGPGASPASRCSRAAPCSPASAPTAVPRRARSWW